MFGRSGAQVVKTFGKKTSGVAMRKITSADDSFDERLASAKKRLAQQASVQDEKCVDGREMMVSAAERYVDSTINFIHIPLCSAAKENTVVGGSAKSAPASNKLLYLEDDDIEDSSSGEEWSQPVPLRSIATNIPVQEQVRLSTFSLYRIIFSKLVPRSRSPIHPETSHLGAEHQFIRHTCPRSALAAMSERRTRKRCHSSP